METDGKKFVIPKDQLRSLLPALGSCFATDRIMVDGRKVGYMYREPPDHDGDSGWRFLAGDESQDYLDDASHTGLYTVNTVANYDPDIIPYVETPSPCAFEKVAGTSTYQQIEEP